jgi:glycosyltransferase involved in cell wall biosynthesis
MACGTPVVATRLASTPEIVREAVAGELFEPRSADALATAISNVLQRCGDANALRTYAEQYGWDSTSRAQVDLFESILRNQAGHWREAVQ